MPRKTSAKKPSLRTSRSNYIAARKVWVVMSNDFPDSVWRRERAAKEYTQKMNCDNREAIASGKSLSGIRIYYNVHEMELR